MSAVIDALNRMAERPLSLSLGVEAFLSMQHLEGNMDSLAKGAERFQPSIITALEQGSNSLQQVREQFQGYLLDLSRFLEKNLSIASRDVETCREQMWKRPASSAAPPQKKRGR